MFGYENSKSSVLRTLIVAKLNMKFDDMADELQSERENLPFSVSAKNNHNKTFCFGKCPSAKSVFRITGEAMMICLSYF